MISTNLSTKSNALIDEYTHIEHSDHLCSNITTLYVHCNHDNTHNVSMCMKDMKSRYGQQICLKGNIDCTAALCTGTEEEVILEVQRCLDEAASGSGLILSSSNTIHRGVKPENYRAMLNALRKYGKFPLQRRVA
jgi:uroporphyrinogen-III decarboxylase